MASPADGGSDSPDVERILVNGVAGKQAANAVRLALAVGRSSADIIHLVGTNALVFSPLYKLSGSSGRIVRHVFTTYDRKDRLIGPARWLADDLFIDAYAFTMPWMGRWAGAVGSRTRRFVIRPPIDCDIYRPLRGPSHEFVPVSSSTKTVLYMGPLLGSRFPAVACLSALKMLAETGMDVHLVVLASTTRTPPESAARLVDLAVRMGIGGNLTVGRVDLSERQRVEAYNSADVVLFPFVGPVPEKLADPPFGILEAMSCGRVVLATRVLSIPEVVEDGVTGFLARDATAVGLFDGLRSSLNLENASEIGTGARRRILAEFSYDRIREELLRAYEALLSGS